MSYDVERTPPDELGLIMRSGQGLVVLETHEERRAIELVRHAAESIDRRCYAWSCIRGLVDLGTDKELHNENDEQCTKPVEAVAELESIEGPWVAIFADLHKHLDTPEVLRAIREMSDHGSRHQHTVVLISPLIDLPLELERLGVNFPMPLPDVRMFEEIIRRVYNRVREGNPHVSAEITVHDMERLTEAMLGLTEAEADRLLTQAILRDGRLDRYDVDDIREAKRRAVAGRGQLEVIPITDNLEQLGGLLTLKMWLRERKKAFSPKAKSFGLSPPRGVLLLGVPGCGKSLCARLTAGEWKRPLLRLDMGSLFNKFIGSSESNLREALRQAEAMAPCVLWIDEIEKAFASASAETADGGVSQRMFATMLNWMNDRQSDVFIVATANQVFKLPPELMRKGRFDEIFFVDLPPEDARHQIFHIHLERRHRRPNDFDIKTLAEITDGFSGAEIEQVVVSALYSAYNVESELSSEFLVQAVKKTRSMTTTMAEQITALRQWAESRCVSAH